MTNPRDITCDTQGHLWSADRCIMCHAPKPRDEPRTSKERVLVSIEEAKRAFVAHYKRAVDDDHDPDHCWIDGYATALRDRATFEPLARSAPDVPHAALARLSQAMGNPAVDWREDTSIEEGLIDEAIRRLTQPPTARPCTHCFSPPELRNPRAGDRCIGCGIDWEDRFSATTQPPRVAVPDKIFDGYSIWVELQNDEEARKRTSHENVQDVLNAIVRYKRPTPVTEVERIVQAANENPFMTIGHFVEHVMQSDKPSQPPTITLTPQERHALWNCVEAARCGFAWTDPTGRKLLKDLYDRTAVTKGTE